MSDDSTPKLEEELEMRRWAEERLVKLGSLLEIAESRDIDVTDARTNYYAARDELYTKKEPSNLWKIQIKEWNSLQKN